MASQSAPASEDRDAKQAAGRGGGQGRRKSRAPKRITQKYLDNVALWYLGRYASSADNLRRVLMRRVRRSCAYHGTDEAEAAAWVDDLVARYRRSGLLDDRRYAEARAGSLLRRGKSIRHVRGDLRARGVAADDIDLALAEATRDQPDPDLAAACALARRRRLGPWGAPEGRDERRQKELAALGRAGFSYDLARRIIDAPTPEDLIDPEI